ncbi:YciK family oxidoreductase [Aliivibrio fischeri]|uniref:Predicted oxoacyl-(Acyl carrier protein) reductase, EmrKY-TolC system n=1 Tax=Aliivibrio fischeri (strain ATCC 700601 / ES114) TaxID=312309 RepID=Q5E612_ALIF1|nr:YciK family oxidoreductase [Aliivibrio fischeri]AAW85534.1 predicted oxoacyl-(acyl carrier protein) reductase, EmrKY-TolC system [Aliivibrio fischeri ES114]KLU80187.1 3-oxoacyl-ACP reductase [Aliivibrio fischeri]MBP3141602.1 YciK family oxidoreductase [Aliivibrio fischeri]MBP3157779.1 YciK family oxidoreductase [Aliivibrio fischeri]MCE7564751.1 YciK family oxidoreductase [Aliivibrio fischeri]
MDYQVSSDALKNKVILVTGAGDGIGKQAALHYAQHGATVILLGRTVAKLEAVYDEIEAAGYPTPAIVPLDLKGATKQHYVDMAETIQSQFGKLDGLLHNAGLLGMLSPFEQFEESIFDEVMQINVKAQFLMTQALLPVLQQSDDARIVFTTSTVGHQGRAFWGAYAISKFATEGMMQTLAHEMEGTTVKVNAINPGGTHTRMRAQAFPAEDISLLKTPKDIMPLYVYLMAPEGVNVHSQCIDAQPK